jgi:predicted DNA-binding transcriptional regulator YafY
MIDARRLYRYMELFKGLRHVSKDTLLSTLEISPATLKRDLAHLREERNMPITFDRDRSAYYLNRQHVTEELPGVWFSPDEVLALLTVQGMLAGLEPSVLGPKLKPIQDRLNTMLARQGLALHQTERIRLVHAGKRQLPIAHFQTVAKATFERRRLRIVHFNRQRGDRSEREISPQQLVHYRDNWYVDARCHLRKDIRCFSVDTIEACDILDTPADEVDTEQLRASMSASYGIFGGAPKGWARLRFTAERARWVRNEQWHPEQKSVVNKDGTLDLEVPYSDERELLGDVLRYGQDVEVLGPAGLRKQVAITASAMAQAHRDRKH